MMISERARLAAVLLQFTHNGKRIPVQMHNSILDYLAARRDVAGAFLKAVICNDLRKSVSYADDENINLLPVYVSFFYNEAPGGSWGSPEAYEYWISGSA